MGLASSATITDFLRHLALFEGLSDEELTRLAAMGHEVGVAPGEVLMREGEPGDAMYVVLSGEFEITKKGETGEMPIARRSAGEVIGEIALLDSEPRTATVRALSESKLLKIDRDSFNTLLAWSPNAIRSILKTVIGKLRNTEVMLRQSEKMASLGTLAAGIAHELNNPAAAARRAAKQLATDVATVERLERELSPEILERWSAWEKQARAGDGKIAVDPLERADQESELQVWLEGQGMDDPWEAAPQLLGLGLQRRELEALTEGLRAAEVKDFLAWLAARGSARTLMTEIASSAERISTIVGAIKSYVYLDQAPVQEVDIHKGLEDTLIIMHFKLKQGVIVKREYARDLPRIEAYASELNQVWTNIIDNAIDAMGGKGEIRIRTWADTYSNHPHPNPAPLRSASGTFRPAAGEGSDGAGRVVVEICDNGPGIPPPVLPHIFDPFFTTKPIGKGTGLGLHISFNIVTVRHHGQISVESRPGETCFRVALPIRQ